MDTACSGARVDTERAARPCALLRKARGRHGAKYTEEMEDADLLKDEAGGAEVGHRLSQQPSVIKHGIMREYQMQGLNWLIHLYDNGINGILADEMARAPLHPLPVQHSQHPAPGLLAPMGKTKPSPCVAAYLVSLSAVQNTHVHVQHVSAGLRQRARHQAQHHSAERIGHAARAGPGEDAADDQPAGLPARVPGHPRAAHGDRAQVHAAQLDQRVPQVVPRHPRRQVPRQPG